MGNKKAKWKKQSEEFRAIMRQGKTTTGFGVDSMGGKDNQIKKGGSGGGKNTGKYVPTPSSLTDDYNHCNMCNRKYNEQAYLKHLPTCERRAKESVMKNNIKSGTTSSSVSSKPNLNVRFNKR